MEYEMKPYIVYVKTDEMGRILAVNSSAFLNNTEGWTEIDSGYGDKYHHAQGNYLPDALWDEYGIPNFKLENGKAVERTQAERDADYANYIQPEAKPTLESRVESVENKSLELEETLDMLLSGVTEDE